MRLGYEIFYTDPGKAADMRCRVCGSVCTVKRNVYTPANFEMALNKVSDLYDVFTCPHAGKGWHEQAVRLLLAIEETPSKRLAGLMKLDLKDILEENGIP
jgi:hypothetical protein